MKTNLDEIRLKFPPNPSNLSPKPLSSQALRPIANYEELMNRASAKEDQAKLSYQRREALGREPVTLQSALPHCPLPDIEEEKWANPLSPKGLDFPKETPKVGKDPCLLDNAFFTGGKDTPSKRLETSIEKQSMSAFRTPAAGYQMAGSRQPSAAVAREYPKAPALPAPLYTSAAVEWRREQVWTQTIRQLNQLVFHNEDFRDNQEEVINAALAKRDVFVCMPTGGGKSLTFQLTALTSPGITLVIMPLLSLIQDQLVYLRSLGVRVQHFSSSQTQSEQQAIYQQIESDPDTRMLYLTPEKLAQSDRLSGFLGEMYRAGRLARLVIDEAHCVSKWGRDFRADYLKLSSFRQRFPGIPIMALTATATDKVKEDVMQVLAMREAAVFLSSFNRPNLLFSVKPKPKDAIADIARFIQAQHSNQTGLIYCISTKDCERVAHELKNLHNIRAGYYHAKMQAEKRNQTQERWMREEIRVLAATVAFGMGINKANVRFVVHFSLPKSLENYYQEAGRAGRDGNQADCVLYYTYSDKTRQDYLRQKSSKRGEPRSDSSIELNTMIKYCEDIYTCRRKQQLAHFGEEFDASRCAKTCDNCILARNAVSKDLTAAAVSILKVLEGNRQGINTLLQIVGLLKGGNTKQLENLKYHECYGLLKHMNREDVERLMHQLVWEEVFSEVTVANYKGFSTVLEKGKRAADLMAGRLSVHVLFEKKGKVALPSSQSAAEEIGQVAVPYERKPAATYPQLVSADPPMNLLMPSLESLQFQPLPQLPCIDPSHLPPDLAAELKGRLQFQRKRLAKRANKPIYDILSDELLETLSHSVTLPPGVLIPKEICKEMRNFAETNDLVLEQSEEEAIIEDSSDEEFANPLCLKRKREESEIKSEKRAKQV